MQADFPVVLDACVLANSGVCDLFLRLAETPRLYLPRWSGMILDEVKRTQTTKLKRVFPVDLAEHWRQEVTASFPEAMIEGFEHLLPQVTNYSKDRHVLAAAIQGGVPLIVTFNLRHFRMRRSNPGKSGRSIHRITC
jgi:predicted nucleic acid-binding protein